MTILFADALEPEEEIASLDLLGPSTLLTARIASNTTRHLAPEFLDKVSPSLIILFVGTAARDKPSADLLATLSDRTVWRTDERGTLEFIVDGHTLAAR